MAKPGNKKGAKIGPYRNGEAKKEAILLSLKDGSTVSAACHACGISRNTFYSWLKEDSAFATKVDEAQKSRIQHVEDSLYKKAIEGNMTAIIFFLCNREPERWKNVNKVEAELHGQGPIKFVLYDPNERADTSKPGITA